MRFEFDVLEGHEPEVVQAEALQKIAVQLERIADTMEAADG